MNEVQGKIHLRRRRRHKHLSLWRRFRHWSHKARRFVGVNIIFVAILIAASLLTSYMLMRLLSGPAPRASSTYVEPAE